VRTYAALCALAAAASLGAACGGGGGPPALTGWIVYWSESPRPSIHAVRPDGTRAHLILRSGQNAKRPRLSPDRRWVAFDGAPPGKAPLSDFDVQIVRFDGTGRRTLTSSPAWDVDAQWSPDGGRLSFTRSPPRPRDCAAAAVWTVRRDGLGARRLAAGCGAAWSPDGSRLAFVSRSAHDVLVVGAGGGKPRTLLATRDVLEVADWSPDGEEVLITRQRGYGGTDAVVALVGADGSGLRELGAGFAGCFSPDGRTILYTPAGLDSPLHAMDADGSHRRRLIAAPGSQPDWR